jgi:hypothetical protein
MTCDDLKNNFISVSEANAWRNNVFDK